MNHYVRYNRSLYLPLLGHIALWQSLGAIVMCRSAWSSVGYKRTQLVYFLVAWLVEFVTIQSIIVPVEYNVNIPPVGLFVLPLNIMFVAYVLAKARFADYNVVIARVLLHSLTLLVIVVMSLVFVVGMMAVAPTFMNQPQILFTLAQAVVIGFGLVVMLPRFLPRAERMMQERLFGGRYGYQDALAGLVRELSTLATIDQLLSTVTTTVHSQMQVSRVMVLMQDVLSGDYKLQAQSGLGPQDDADAFTLKEDAAIVKWLLGKRDVLVREEMARRVAPWLQQHLETELDRLKVNVCVPMILEQRLVGILCLGEKLNRGMFFVSDLRVLETLATEVALAVKYRRMEDEVSRKNRLVELGTIAAGVAHEIRNPLASIKTFAQLMPDRMDDPEFKNEFSKLVLKDVDRITKVIESMLAFARPAQVTMGDHLANDLVEEAILLVQPRLKSKRIELTREFHGNPVMKVDKHQILQVLVNILSNATDALHEQGKIRVATGVSQRNLGGDGDRNQNYAVIEVSDNGPGIPPAVRGRLFDPFFTTKKEGTGLGLSISQKIVRDHGGAITVSSVEGKGSSFQVNLPLK
jgi:signal transduction histidine kinase